MLFSTIAIFLNSCSITKVTNKQYDRVAQGQVYDVIIVPGAPIGENGLSNILAARILWSKYLVEQGIAKHVIYSGGAVATPYIEGVAMKNHAINIGLPKDKVFAETKAEHSTENVYYSVQMARKMGFEKIAVATDFFQTFMINSFRKKYVPDVQVIPIVFDKIFENKKEFDNLSPIEIGEAHVDEKDFIPLNKRKNFAKRFAGTLGKNINYDPASVAAPQTNKAIAQSDSILIVR